MRTITWKGIAELGGITAILIGLIFVYFEIQQNGAIARAELASGTGDFIDSIYEHLSDPVFAVIYAKSLHEPDKLTEAERIQLNSFLERVVRLFSRERRLFILGIFGEFESIPSYFAPIFFSDGYGEIWWAVRKKTYSSNLVVIIDGALTEHHGRGSFIELDKQITQQIRLK